jgi:hypothetical protein
MSLYRVGSVNGDRAHDEAAPYVPLDVWLADLENERRCLITRLRHVDSILVEYGKLRAETIPTTRTR